MLEIIFSLIHSSVDSKRSSPSLLARQLRLRLVAAEGSDIPRNLNNIVVSIHAIATFQALHDYLRPRVSGLMFSGSRLSGMLAALAASGLAPGSSGGVPASLPSHGESSTSANAGSSSAPASSSSVGRRRSLRLSAKNGGATGTLESAAAAESASLTAPPVEDTSDALAARSTVSDPPVSTTGEVALSETVVNDEAEFAADFTDDEVDAEVC